jgi:uncharacterized protein (DUF2267 family)
MQFREFLGKVQDRARLSSLGDADTATRATLTTLRERLAGGEPKDVASQLTDSIARYLEAPGREEPVIFSIDEFYDRVSQRAGVERSTASFQARAVVSVLSEAVTAGEVHDIREQLPPEFEPLFHFEPLEARNN